MERTKAYRRSAEKKAKAKTVKKIKIEQTQLDLPKEEPDPVTVGVNASCHSSRCSCASCGNPRKHAKGKEKLTRKEKQHDIPEALEDIQREKVEELKELADHIAAFTYAVTSTCYEMKKAQDELKEHAAKVLGFVPERLFFPDEIFEALYNNSLKKEFEKETGMRLFE